MVNLYTVNPSFFNMDAESLTTQLNKDIYQQSWWDLSLEELFLPENTHKTMDFAQSGS